MRSRSLLSLTIFFLAAAASSRADFGSNNPTGPAGVFNGNVTTGCSYDPFTGNATRAITDLVVPGAVGEYPLAFGRISNSRDTSSAFGAPGAWRHSYQWEVDSNTSTVSSSFVPTYYDVNFPDGRVIHFIFSSSDSYFRGPPGVKARFQPLNTSTLLAYLIMPDGGKVEFKATRVSDCDFELNPPCTYSYNYKAQAIIDPYGQRTLLAYNGDGTLNTITEPAGRWMQLSYVTTPWTNGYGYHDVVIDHVSASDGRSVKYNYGLQAFSPGTIAYTYLGNVVYFGDSALTATYSYQAPNAGGANGSPLLSTCNDLMYAGPMKNISYTYQTTPNADGTAAVYGQIQSEKAGGTGQVVSTLGQAQVTWRSDTRGDGPSRTFMYTNGQYVQGIGDFLGRFAYQNYDANFYVNQLNDQNGNITYLTNDPKTGNPTRITYPLTASDTALGKPAATVQYVYGSATCPDPNNRDGNNPYYLYSVTNERGFTTTYTRDPNKRVTQINYPDGGVETYSYNGFGQVTSHRLRTGGLETFTYDTRGLLTQYRDAYHLAAVDAQNPSVPANATPSLSYTYYTSGPSFDRIRTITDARGKVTTVDSYNSRGQVLKVTHPLGQGETVASNIQYAYRTDGVLSLKQDELGHRTYFNYDDYKRLTFVTLPPRVTGDPLPTATAFYYDHTGGVSVSDYSHTDSNPRRIVIPSGKRTQIVYDNNLRKTSVTLSGSDGVADAATTTYTYDNNGNLKTVKDPNGQATGLLTQYFYDARSRLTDLDDPMLGDATTPHRNSSGHTISWILDQGGNKVNQRNANNQLITFDSYDAMNRLLQQTAPQTPDPTAITKHTYYPSGLLKTMQDPHLVETGSSYSYTWTYDLMGRQTRLTYPPDSGGVSRSESLVYDTAGNVQTFTNRIGAVRTFSYDGRNRQTGSTWSDGTTAPALAYDAASRLTQISNADAVINNVYFDDNTLKSQEEWATADAAYHRTLTYAYDVDGNRSNVIYPSGKSFSYGYFGRNDLWYILDNLSGIYQSAYTYDLSGNMIERYVGNYWIMTDARQRDPMNQPKHVEHRFGGTTPTPATRTFDYTYNAMGSRTSIKRDGGAAENYGYDLVQQVTGGVENGSAATYAYDANGNRTALNGGGVYVTNNLNQQTTFNGQTVGYEPKGNVLSYAGVVSYVYDAMNRLKTVTNASGTSTFKYDGLNRKISQTIGGVTTYNVWDGWNLVEERGAGNALQNTYLYDAVGIVERMTGASKYFYFQDGLGNTSHVSDEPGNLLESYKYGTFGQQSVYSPAGVIRSGGSSYDIRHLFTGQLWMPQVGLYDYRNRAYSPTLTRFLQPDPIGFAGDPSNLYRYCGNNPVNRSDPFGLDDKKRQPESFAPSIQGFSLVGLWRGPDGLPNSSGGNPPASGAGRTGVGGYYVVGGAEGLTVVGLSSPMQFLAGDFGFRPGDVQNRDFMHNYGGMGGANMDPFYHYPGTINLLDTPPIRAIGDWGREHLSLDLNINLPQAGGTLGADSTGIYANGGPGPGVLGEATLTINVNFGSTPSGLVIGASGALGDGLAGRAGFGWSSGGGWYFNAGAGMGYALYGGANVGPGGYVKKYGGH